MSETSSPTQDAYVAFFDILGYSDLVANRDADQILSLMRSVWKALPIPVDRYGRGKIRVLHYADTAIGYTWGLDHDQFHALVLSSSKYLFELARAGFGARGSITRGPFQTFRESQSRGDEYLGVAGKAVADAYKWEKRQDWSGGIVAPTAWASLAGERCTECDKLTLDYEVPLKSGSVRVLRAIDWTVWEQGDADVQRQLSDSIDLALNAAKEWEHRRRWEATRAFLLRRRQDTTRARPPYADADWTSSVLYPESGKK